MTIERLNTADIPYYQMARATAQDPDLSAPMLGLLAHLMSRPRNWEVNHSQLARHFKMSRTTIRQMLGELEDLGYASRNAKRVTERNGQEHIIEWEIVIHPTRGGVDSLKPPPGSGESTGWTEGNHPRGQSQTTERSEKKDQRDTYGAQRRGSASYSNPRRDDIAPTRGRHLTPDAEAVRPSADEGKRRVAELREAMHPGGRA